MNYKQQIFIFFVFILFFGCNNKNEINLIQNNEISNGFLKRIQWNDLDGFYEDNLTLALSVFKKDCQSSRIHKSLKKVCKDSMGYKNGELFFTKNFTPYRLMQKDKNDTGLLTGYYEPILNGSFVKNEIYKYPIFKTPKDLITVRLSSIYPELKKYVLRGKIVGNKLVPYETREELSKQKDKLEVLLYVDNKIDKFFLEIQGSGKVKLEDNTIINIAYAQQNGRKYYAIGRKLLQDNLISKEDISLQSIKEWCEANLDKVDELMNLNKSVIFFKKSLKNATGSLGVELVAKRNLAVDRNYVPLGFPVFINTSHPTINKPINSLMVAADVGGAIKGQIRADYFWGNGKNAEKNAGKMTENVKMTILIPNKTTDNTSNQNIK